MCHSKEGSRLVSYFGHEIKALGKSDVAVEYEGRYHVIECQVVDADVIPVLGLQTAAAYNTCQLSQIIRESPGYYTNLLVSHTGHHISWIKSSFELICVLV